MTNANRHRDLLLLEERCGPEPSAPSLRLTKRAARLQPLAGLRPHDLPGGRAHETRRARRLRRPRRASLSLACGDEDFLAAPVHKTLVPASTTCAAMFTSRLTLDPVYEQSLPRMRGI